MAKKFGASKSVVNNFMRKNGLAVSNKLKRKFRIAALHKRLVGKTTATPENDKFIKENYLILPVKQMAIRIGRSETLVKTRMRQLGLITPPEIIEKFKKDSQIQKGNIPVNKGKKQIEFMSIESIERTKATRFQKGQLPHNAAGFKNGDIAIRESHKRRNAPPYKWIRIKLGVWRMLHVYNWEKKYGKVKRGYIIVFKNGDTMNCKPSNLECITRKENMLRNTIHRFPEDLQTAIRTVSKLNKTIDHVNKEQNN